MKINKKSIIGILIFIGFISVSPVFSQTFGYNTNYSNYNNYNPNSGYVGYSGGYNYYGSGYNPSSGNYFGDYNYYGDTNPSVFWPSYNTGNCYANQNLILQIAPGGCSPSVVTSDLLEEQNVPVFCKLMSITANPLIDVSRIRSVRFQGQYPKGISGISYFPSRSALARNTGAYGSLVSSPINTDLGYMIIVLARQPIESNMSESIGGNITAVIDYDSEGAYGIGQTNFYVSMMNDNEWLSNFRDYGFWNGKAYIRAEAIEKDRATISVYRDFNSKQGTVTLKEGETSKDIYLSGFYCGAGLNVRLDKIDVPVESALLQVNDKQVWVSKGDKIINDKCSVASLESSGIGGKISISCPVTNGKIDLSLGTLNGSSNTSIGDVGIQEGLAFEYYDKSIKTYTDLYDFYPNEKRIPEEDSYAAIGLYEGAKLSKKFGMNSKARELYDKLKKNYPDAMISSNIEREESFVRNYDTRNSKASIVINNQQYFIDLLDFRKPSKNDLGAVLVIDGKEETLGLNEVRNLVSNSSKNIQIMEIKANSIGIRYTKTGANSKKEYKNENLVIGKNEQTSFDGFNIKLVRINSNRQVKLSLIPKILGQRGESSFNFRIGIEKRAIKLSPEQTKDIMENLKSSIKQWNDINEKLGKVIKVMKGACFATSMILTAKTMLTGINGASIAREKIMNGLGGWYEFCEKQVNEKKFSTLQQCLLSKNSEIESDVKSYGNQIKETNNIIKGIENEVGKGKNGYIDSGKVQEKFKEKFSDFCKNAQGSVSLSDKTSVSFTGENGICSWQNLTFEQRRDIMTLYNSKDSGSSVLKEVSNRELGKTVLDAKNYHDSVSSLSQSQKDNSNLGINTLNPAGDSVIRGDIKKISKSDLQNQVYKNFKEGSSVVRVFIPVKKTFGNTQFSAHSDVAGKEVIVEIKESGGAKGTYSPSGAVYSVEGKEITGDALKSVREYMGLSGMDRIKNQDLRDYKNPMKNPEKLFVKYFETAPFRGLPAEIPFDVNEGWYVEMQYVISGFGKPYDESGRAVNFYICNVGSNGLIEFKKSSDDICRYYNGNVNANLDFPGLSASESNRLVQRAQQAIADAARQYGKENVVINGKNFKSGKSFGGGEGKCTDFMSVMDCNLLFNVCDPVICPASRCDLGGRYRVDNVVQSGIIGSLMLCLPNSREGIAIPFCLTGIHAGIEGYTSILNSTVMCLNESLATGRNVGICDEIKSIYICEFFWKQAAPFLNMVIPTLFQGMYGQSRGGGEYLTVQNAWENTQGAISWFTNQYAINSIQAFKYRSIDNAGVQTGDIGAEFCKSFISVNTGGARDLLENLIEPDSPAQYHAWFSEDVLTTATVPPTSHYKVYYHIYAGKDFGSYYVVYLTGMSGASSVGTSIIGTSSIGTSSVLGSYGSSVFSTGYYTVASGFVGRGSQVDEARDFTAPSGFKQLCININGKDECGFGQVSTSYMLNSISDMYVQEQTQQKISSEKECIAGTPSFYSLGQPNIQAGIQEVLESQLYNAGIVRVCASENPGKQVITSTQNNNTKTSYDRWQDVGYCDDPKIRCWLDTNSVKAVVRDKQIENEILNNRNLSLINQGYVSEEQSFSEVNIAEAEIDSLIISSSDTRGIIENKINQTVDKLIRLSKTAPTNVYRARSLYSLGRLYRKVAESLLIIEKPKVIVDSMEVLEHEENMSGVGQGSSSGKKVERADITDEGYSEGMKIFSISIYQNGELKKVYIKDFDYEKQMIIFPDDNLRKLAKDSSGKIIYASELMSLEEAGRVSVSLNPDIILEFQDGSAEKNLFYKFSDKWLYSLDSGNNWRSEEGAEGDEELSEKNINFIKNFLKGKSCDDGLKALVIRAMRNEEGGWFGNAALIVHKGSESKEFQYTKSEDIKCSNLNKIFS